MSLCDVFRKHIVVYKVLSSLRTILEHGAHRCITVDVCILSLDVRIFRVGISELIVDVHKIRLSFTDLCVLSAVKDVRLGGLFPVILDEHCFNDVLHLLYSACLAVELLHDFLCEIGEVDAGHLLAINSLVSGVYGVEDLGLIERHLLAVSFDNAFHDRSLRYIVVIYIEFSKYYLCMYRATKALIFMPFTHFSI